MASLIPDEQKPHTRQHRIGRLQDEYDLLVIGGGINGLATAWDASLRGLRVLIVDKGDWGSGTSSWSSRLIHGGLKYLEHLEVGLVRESLTDREWLLTAAPHLVKPLAFIMPFYKTNQHSQWILRLGMLVYDVLSVGKSVPNHTILSRSATIDREPGIDTAGLQGAGVYYDAQIAYAERLCIEILLAAERAGAVAVNYMSAETLLRAADADVVTGARVRDELTGRSHDVRAKVTINAAGPWIDEVLSGTPMGSTRLNGGTKGTHLIVDTFPGAPTEECVYYEARSDGRQVLVIPWLGRCLIGSTDKRFTGDLDRAMPDNDEVDYILAETNLAFPEAHLTRESIRFGYTGVRPLPFRPQGDEGKITRKHIVKNHAPQNPGLVTLIGGKLTTFRTLGEHATDAAARALGVRVRSGTRRDPLPGAAAAPAAVLAAIAGIRPDLSPEAGRRLVAVYGSRALQVLSLAETEPALAGILSAGALVLRAEVVFAIRFEQAVHLQDVIARRTMWGLENDLGQGIVVAAAELMAEECGWDATRTAEEIAQYAFYSERFTRTEEGDRFVALSAGN